MQLSCAQINKLTKLNDCNWNCNYAVIQKPIEKHMQGFSNSAFNFGILKLK